MRFCEYNIIRIKNLIQIQSPTAAILHAYRAIHWGKKMPTWEYCSVFHFQSPSVNICCALMKMCFAMCLIQANSLYKGPHMHIS
jgi:hypothetical protein